MIEIVQSMSMTSQYTTMWSLHVTSHHTTSHHITSHHTTSHHTTSHHTTSHHTTPHHTTPHHTTPHKLSRHDIVSYVIIWYDITLYHSIQFKTTESYQSIMVNLVAMFNNRKGRRQVTRWNMGIWVNMSILSNQCLFVHLSLLMTLHALSWNMKADNHTHGTYKISSTYNLWMHGMYGPINCSWNPCNSPSS